jgi:type IV pilus assembly protein PilF
MKFSRYVFLMAIIFSLIACTRQIQERADEQSLKVKQKQASDLNTKIGLNYLEEGDFVLAKEKLLSALQKNPNSFFTNSAMAYYYEKTGHIKTAEEYYIKARHLAEVKGSADNNYGTFLCRQKRYAEADQYFQKAVNDPLYINTAKAYENAGICAQLIPNNSKAFSYFEKALENDPNLTLSTLALAKIYHAQHEDKKAYVYLQTYLLLEKHPSEQVLSLTIELAEKTGDHQGVTLYQTKLNKMSIK